MYRRKSKILFVDDEAFFREYYLDTLSQEFDVTGLSNGKDVVETIKKDKPDLILLDRVMPDINGDDICRELKGNKETMDIPVIMVTQLTDKDDLIAGFNIGADDYVTKPIYLPELLAKIRSRLSAKQLYKEFESEELLNILEVYETVTTFHSRHEILGVIAKKVSESINATRCSVLRVDEDENCAYIVTSGEDESESGLKISLNDFPEIKKALHSMGNIVIDDLTEDSIIEDVGGNLKNRPPEMVAIIPISIRDKYTGTLILRVTAPREGLSDRDLSFCVVLAKAASKILTNAKLVESLRLANVELEKLATTDGLTGIYNHRYFYNRLDEEFNIAMRYNVSLACIMIDIDYFKNVNDTYGHREGDKILIELAVIMNRTIRKTDIAVRYGGEEFALLLPHTNEEGALFQAERVRMAVREHRFSGLSKDLNLTISLGIATSQKENIKTAEDLVRFADKALYEAKKRGRDNSVLYSQDALTAS